MSVDGTHGEVRWAWSAGSSAKLRWRLAATGTRLGSMELGPGTLANIEQLSSGEVIRATLSTWLKFVAADETSPRESPIGIVDRTDGGLKTLPEMEMTVAQRRIIEHLAKLRLNPDVDNEIEIASHEVEFVRGS